MPTTQSIPPVPEPPDLLAGQQFPAEPKQERSRRKREALLASALALFGERGYDETSVEEIAHRAGVAVGAFYQHFASKRQALLLLMSHLVEEVSALPPSLDLTTPSRVHEGIKALVRRSLQLDWSYAGAYRAWREASVRDPELRHLHSQLELWVAGQLELLLRALQTMPGARGDVDTQTLSWTLSVMFWRMAETSLDDAEPVVSTVTDLIYHTVFTDAPGAEEV